MPIAAFVPDEGLTEEQIEAELEKSSVRAFFSVKFWSEFNPDTKLVWSRPLRFTKNNKSKLPAKKGVYAFSIRPSRDGLPGMRFVFYIGQAGAQSDQSQNTIRERFGTYFKERRPRVRKYLKRYEGHIDFQYCELDGLSAAAISTIETKLNDAMQPVAVQNDFSPKVRTARIAVMT